jgi:hypothetical protein
MAAPMFGGGSDQITPQVRANVGRFLMPGAGGMASPMPWWK